MTDETAPRKLRGVIRLKDSKPFTGFEPSYASKLIEEGKLPPLRQLTVGGRALGWFDDDLIEHQDQIAEQPPVNKLPPERRIIERVRLTPEAIERHRSLRKANNG